MTGPRGSERDRALVRAVAWLHRALLIAYPPAFRRRHGDEMARLYRDRARAAAASGGAPAVIGSWLGAVRDLALNAPAEWIKPGGRWPRERGGGGMGGFVKDLGWALRSLRRSPGFAAVAVLTIALAMAANTAIFSVVQAVLLRPLPYRDPDQLVMIWADLHRRNLVDFPISPPDFLDIRDQTQVFSGVAGAVTGEGTITEDGEPARVTIGQVTWDWFDLLGVRPELGRPFVQDDAIPGPDGVQPGQPGFLSAHGAISHELWTGRFGADPEVLGRVVDLGGGPIEIVAVMPERLQLLMPAAAAVAQDVDVWVVPRFDFARAPRGNVFLRVIGRMRPGVTLEQANADLDRSSASSREKLPGWAAAELDFRAEPLLADLTEPIRPVILVLMGAVGFVLLIACANVSNLLLVRASTRQREIAVRAALGGSRGRIVRQLLAESLAIAAMGTVLGTVLARFGVDALLRFRPEGLPRLDRVSLDGAVLGFTALASVAAAVLFGVLPAVQSSRPDFAESLKERSGAGLGAQRRLRSAVVIAEVALSLVLLVGVGLMARTFTGLQQVELGQRPDGAVTFAPSLPFGRYRDQAARDRFFTELQGRLAAQRGVTAVSGGLPLPLGGDLFNGRWSRVEDIEDPTAYKQASYFAVQPGFFDALGTRLLEGRDLTAADNADSASVVVVNRTMAEKAFPGESAVGKPLHVRVSSQDPQIVQIVGVVEDQRMALTGDVREAVYFTVKFTGGGDVSWVVRSGLDLATVTALIRREVGAMDPLLPIEVEPLTKRVNEALAPTRFALVLITVFGAMALVMAAVGLYGVLAFTVRQRTAEIGVRMAFGAERGTILKLVVGQGMALALAGVGIGVAASLALRNVLASVITGMRPGDPAAFIAAPVFFLVVAALACLIPAVRATRVDPLEALRAE